MNPEPGIAHVGLNPTAIYPQALRPRVNTILPLPKLCGMYCNNGGWGGDIILRNGVDDDGVGVRCLNKGWVRKE